MDDSISDVDIGKLRENKYFTVESVPIASKSKLSKMAGFSDAKIDKIYDSGLLCFSFIRTPFRYQK